MSDPEPEQDRSTETDDTPPAIPRDSRAVWVAVAGIAGIVFVVIVGLKMLPGPISTGQTDNASGAIGGAIGAAVAAISAVVSAYFGIRAANQSAQAATQTAQQSGVRAQQTTERLQDQNERIQAANERAQVTLTEVAGAASSNDVQKGLDRAAEKIEALNLK